MKCFVGLLCLMACAAYVRTESCTVNSDCGSTLCSTNFHVICEHKNEDGVTTNGGLCTCAKDDMTCATASDCTSFPCPDNRNPHCYDGKCICTRW